MTFKQFLSKVNQFAKDNPETLEMLVITQTPITCSIFNEVDNELSKGVYYKHVDEYYDGHTGENETMAVCIN